MGGTGGDNGQVEDEVSEEEIVSFLEKQVDAVTDVDADKVYRGGVVALPFEGFDRRLSAMCSASAHCKTLYVALLTGDGGAAQSATLVDQVAECLRKVYTAVDTAMGSRDTGAGTLQQASESDGGTEVIVGLPIGGLGDAGNVALRADVDLLLSVSGAGIDKWANAIGALNLMRASVGAGKLKFLECGNESQEHAGDGIDVASLPPLQETPPSRQFDTVAVVMPPPAPATSLRDHKLALSVGSFLLSPPPMPSPHGPPITDAPPRQRRLLLLFADQASPCGALVSDAAVGLSRRFVTAAAAGKVIDASDSGAFGAVRVQGISSFEELYKEAECVVTMEGCQSHARMVREENDRRRSLGGDIETLQLYTVRSCGPR